MITNILLFSFRPFDLNLLVGIESIGRKRQPHTGFPVGAKNLSPSLFFSPFLSCQRHESSGRKRNHPIKNINLGEVVHLPPTPCRNKVARLRHAGLCVWVRISTDSRKAAPCGDLPRMMVISCCGIGMRAKDFSPLQKMPNDYQHPIFFQAFRSESIGRKILQPTCIFATSFPVCVFRYEISECAMRLMYG
jgi:hypothetical protein